MEGEKRIFNSVHSGHRITMRRADNAIIEGRRTPIAGRYIQFEDNVFVTSDPEEIEFLYKFNGFGTTVFDVTNAAKAPEPKAFVPAKPLMKMDPNELRDYANFLDIDVAVDDTNDEIRQAIANKLIATAKGKDEDEE
jgi:hypothetical protein